VENRKLKEQALNLQKHAKNSESFEDILGSQSPPQVDTILEVESDSTTTSKGPTSLVK